MYWFLAQKRGENKLKAMLFACKMMQFTALNPTNNHAKCLKKQDELIGITTKNHGILHNYSTHST